MSSATNQSLSLLTFYRGWGTYQRMLTEMLAPLTDEQLELKAGPHRWTVGMVAGHMIANRVWWFQVWMGAGDPALAHIAHWDPADLATRPPRGKAELLAGLAATWQLVEDALGSWTAADLDTAFDIAAAVRDEERQFYRPFSRQWIIWHVLEHEIHHGGELSIALGEHGLPGIYGEM
jgi:uncharacterized damage-inducible protein DinB